MIEIKVLLKIVFKDKTMPTGVLHLKEVDTDKITLDGTLSVSGASKLEGDTVVDSTLSVGGTVTLADTNAVNVNLAGTLSVGGQTTISGDIIPDTNDAYDIGSPEFKIRDMYVSDNSLWIGDTTKISNVGGRLKFRKRKTDATPQAVVAAGLTAGYANEEDTTSAALSHAGVSELSQMRLQHWHRFMLLLNPQAKLTDIFRDTNDDYEETSASDAWKEISDTKIYTDMNVGIGTSDPDEALHIRGAIKVEDGFSLARNEGNDPSLVIDTRNFGVDETVNDLTGNEFNKYTKLYRVYGTNSQGVGQNWYWGYAQDDYTKFSLSFDGNGGNDPDIAFVFTTASELHCNKVFAALGGNADTATLAATATRLETPRKINGVDFDGTQDITIETGIQGITKPNGGNDVCIQPGKLGVGIGSPGYKLDVESLDFTVARFKQRDSGEGAGIKLENGDGYTWNVATDTDGKFGIYRDGQSFRDFSIKDGNIGVGTSSAASKLHVDEGVILKSATAQASTGYNHVLNGPRPGETSGGAQHFINGTGRTDDGGVSTYTIRNDNGPLRLGHASYSTEIVNGVCSTDFSVGTQNPTARLTVTSTLSGGENTIPTANMGENTAFPNTTHLWLANKHSAHNPYWGLAIGTIWSGASYIQNLNKRHNSYYNLLLQPNGGNVGIGTNNPACPFHVKFSTHAARSSGNRFEDASSTNYWENWINNGDYFYFSYNGSDRGWIQGPNGGGATKMPNFTGQHITYIKDIPFTRATECEGLIVSSDQNKYIKMNEGVETGSNAITINECLPVVSLSKVTNDKKCFGVISASEDPETRTVLYGAWGSVAEKEKGDTRVYINSVGEGAIWVVNTIGSLEAGDYITTSDVAGYGQKQDDDVLHNYTVAKITMDCDFEPMAQPVQIIKKGMVRQELVNILDEHGQIQWEDHPTETEKAYKIRYLDANGNITDDETNAVHKAAFVGCTYHCG